MEPYIKKILSILSTYWCMRIHLLSVCTTISEAQCIRVMWISITWESQIYYLHKILSILLNIFAHSIYLYYVSRFEFRKRTFLLCNVSSACLSSYHFICFIKIQFTFRDSAFLCENGLNLDAIKILLFTCSNVSLQLLIKRCIKYFYSVHWDPQSSIGALKLLCWKLFFTQIVECSWLIL